MALITRPTPIDAVFATTYRCNARCQMCNIWRVKEHDDLRPAEYENIPDTLRHINISGGEPFLRADLPEIVRVISGRNPRAHILVSSNGFQPARTVDSVRQMLRYHRRLGVGISIDGIGDKHDEVRGIPGAYAKSTETIRRLRADVGLKDIRVAFTLQDSNAGHLLPVYELSRQLGVQFTWVVAQTSPHYFQNASAAGHWTGATPLDVPALELMRRQLRSPHPKDWARAFFSLGNLRRAWQQPRPIQCRAGARFFFVAPHGEVHACNARSLPLGNIRTQRWSEIWTSRAADDVRDTVSRCTDHCWMVCTARTSMLEDAPRVAAWIALQKLRVHLGLDPALPAAPPAAAGMALPVLQS
jgi:MoaA/NifB/PqqE/SkfB family radical SAM enzyme